MTPLDLVVRVTVHDGPSRELHMLLVDALSSVSTPSDAEVAEALARFEAEADLWALWNSFSKARFRCLERGISDARRYDVSFDYSPAAPGLANWAALHAMAETRTRFMPWDRDSVVSHLRALAPVFRDLGAARVQLFGSIARGEWRDTSDVDLMVFAKLDLRLDTFGIAESVGQECQRLFGYAWQAQSGESYRKDFLERIADEAIEVLK